MGKSKNCVFFSQLFCVYEGQNRGKPIYEDQNRGKPTSDYKFSLGTVISTCISIENRIYRE